MIAGMEKRMGLVPPDFTKGIFVKLGNVWVILRFMELEHPVVFIDAFCSLPAH